MDCLAGLIRWGIAPLWARWEGSAYLRHYRRLRRTQFDAPAVIRERQWEALRSLIAYAGAHVPFYQERFQHAGIAASQLQSVADLQRIPVLTKQDIREHGPTLRSPHFPLQRLHCKQTSGSTGVSLQVHVDDASMQWKRACALRSDEWSGWRFGQPVARVWGNPEYLQRGWRGKLRNALLERSSYLDTLQMDEASLASFVERLERLPPALLFGHAHSVYLLARFVQSRGGSRIRPCGIITTAMALHSWERSLIEQVFSCKVTNRYGCEEVSLIACECEQHSGFHINSDGVYLEVLRDGQPVSAGEPGSIVVTDLTNHAMPIIRYQVGDVAVLADRRCPCGRGLPLIERLEGREADYVRTASGKLVSGISLTENFALLVPGLAQLQLIQESLQRFRLKIVRDPSFGPHSLRRIDDLVKERFGAGADYECEFVDKILPEPSGKYRFCISRVADPFAPSAVSVS